MRNNFSKSLCLLIALTWLAMFTPLAYSQSSDADVQEPASDIETEIADEEAQQQQQSTEETAPEIAQVEDEEEQSSSRFIPTEQLSQDLGASFPVDI